MNSSIRSDLLAGIERIIRNLTVCEVQEHEVNDLMAVPVGAEGLLCEGVVVPDLEQLQQPKRMEDIPMGLGAEDRLVSLMGGKQLL